MEGEFLEAFSEHQSRSSKVPPPAGRRPCLWTISYSFHSPLALGMCIDSPLWPSFLGVGVTERGEKKKEGPFGCLDFEVGYEKEYIYNIE